MTTKLLKMMIWCTMASASSCADDLSLTLRTQLDSPDKAGVWQRTTRAEKWKPEETAIIVCDVWDRHHCLNAVRRMTEFLPRMNEVLTTARSRGVTIIHAPSDCMPAYTNHPARARAEAVAGLEAVPHECRDWCSAIPQEELAVYPIDQSDGGEDDDPREHAEWAATLKAEGRNPGLPWKAQNEAITIDAKRDYISDRGDEVQAILAQNSIRNVILVGVHTNMCVLGRPFGLRQMVRTGRNVVLVRDLTDCMYNPKRWPYVDHFTGNDLIISHVERYVCPTITSDQIVGGSPFAFSSDHRSEKDVTRIPDRPADAKDLFRHWTTVALPRETRKITGGDLPADTSLWIRCSVKLPGMWIGDNEVTLEAAPGMTAWLNGVELNAGDHSVLRIPSDAIVPDDINLLVVRFAELPKETIEPPSNLRAGLQALSLKGRWQIRAGQDPTWSNLPLPAKFGLGSDVLFDASEAIQ